MQELTGFDREQRLCVAVGIGGVAGHVHVRGDLDVHPAQNPVLRRIGLRVELLSEKTEERLLHRFKGTRSFER